jgi:hypothetical protein
MKHINFIISSKYCGSMSSQIGANDPCQPSMTPLSVCRVIFRFECKSSIRNPCKKVSIKCGPINKSHHPISVELSVFKSSAVIVHKLLIPAVTLNHFQSDFDYLIFVSKIGSTLSMILIQPPFSFINNLSIPIN